QGALRPRDHRAGGLRSDRRPSQVGAGVAEDGRQTTDTGFSFRPLSSVVCLPMTMPDTAQLEQQILADVAAASDQAALEAVRVAALGKNGSVTALLKTLGTLSPDERKSQGPLINGLKDRVNA